MSLRNDTQQKNFTGRVRDNFADGNIS